MGALGFVKGLLGGAGGELQRQLGRAGVKTVEELAQKILPAVYSTGDRVLVENTTNALRNLGVRVPSLPGPGVIGTRTLPSASRPAPSQLPESVRNLVGPPPKPVTTRAAAPATSAPGVRGVSPLVQNRPPAPLAEAPVAPVRYPGPAPVTETARQITMLKPGADEVGSMGTRLTYRPGTQGLEGRLGSTTYGQGAEVGASSLYPRFSPSKSNLTTTVGNVAEEAGTPLFAPGVVEPYISPRPAFGPGGSTETVDRIMDLAFGRRGPGGGGAASALEGGPGGALVRSPGGAVVDELMIDPVRVREIFEAAPELMGSFRNAAGGLQTADLSNLISNPALLAAVTAAAGATGYGLAGLMDRNRKGETTAGSPPETPDVRLFGDTTPAASGGIPSPTNLDPAANNAPVITGGDTGSDVRAALAQHAPAAAAVMRAAEPMSPEKYRSIEEYAAAKQAYSQAKPELQNLMRFMEGQSPTAGGGLAMWAATHPDLAYRYQQQMLKNDAANQQGTGSTTGTAIVAPIGSKNDDTAVGNAEATASFATEGTPGAKALQQVTTPYVAPYLQRTEDFIQRQAPRSAMYAGY